MAEPLVSRQRGYDARGKANRVKTLNDVDPVYSITKDTALAAQAVRMVLGLQQMHHAMRGRPRANESEPSLPEGRSTRTAGKLIGLERTKVRIVVDEFLNRRKRHRRRAAAEAPNCGLIIRITDERSKSAPGANAPPDCQITKS